MLIYVIFPHLDRGLFLALANADVVAFVFLLISKTHFINLSVFLFSVNRRDIVSFLFTLVLFALDTNHIAHSPMPIEMINDTLRLTINANRKRNFLLHLIINGKHINLQMYLNYDLGKVSLDTITHFGVVRYERAFLFFCISLGA